MAVYKIIPHGHCLTILETRISNTVVLPRHTELYSDNGYLTAPEILPIASIVSDTWVFQRICYIGISDYYLIFLRRNKCKSAGRETEAKTHLEMLGYLEY